jgi:hypothetical protein
MPALTPYTFPIGIITLVRHPHLDADPYKAANFLQGYKGRLKTAGEIATWWREDSTLGAAVDTFEPIYNHF